MGHFVLATDHRRDESNLSNPRSNRRSMDLEFQTSRLLVRKVAVSDNEFFFKLVNSPGWLKFIGNRNVNSSEDAVHYINKIQNTANLTYGVVTMIDTRQTIGIISFIKRDYLEHFDIGFAFLPEFMGKGYAFEAANGLFSSIAKKPEYQIIQAVTIPGNNSSIKLLTKLGMRFEKEIEVGTEKLHIYST
jgi:ribosomal-protein-alanine N-acetyltransferase